MTLPIWTLCALVCVGIFCFFQLVRNASRRSADPSARKDEYDGRVEEVLTNYIGKSSFVWASSHAGEALDYWKINSYPHRSDFKVYRDLEKANHDSLGWKSLNNSDLLREFMNKRKSKILERKR